MKTPSGSEISIVKGDGCLFVCAPGFDCSLLGNGFLVPCAGYSVGSFVVFSGRTGTLSTGVLSAVVANDASGDLTAAHPAGVTKNAPGSASVGFALEYGFAGVEVTTAQASVVADIYMVLRQ